MDARKDRAANKLHQVVADTGGILETAGERVGDPRERALLRLERGRDQLADMKREAVYRARRAVLETNRYARKHPWHVAGFGVALGIVLGLASGVAASRRR
jgi:ElaB/YqjD/DUF883 family membrane-anchored ribosome-binding protein